MAKTEFTIGHLPITDHLVLGMVDHELKQNGSAHNFCLTCKKMQGWNQIGDALQDGSVDGAFILAPFAMDLFKSGLPIRLLLFGHKNGSILIRNHRAGVDDVADFQGKLVVFPYQLSIHTMIFHKLLSDRGLKLGPGKDVQIEVMAPSQMVQALEFDDEGELGGFIVAEPFGSECVKKGFGEELTLSKDVWPDHPCCVFVMRDEIIQQNTSAVEELCGAMVEAGQKIKQSPADAAKVGATFLDQEEDVVLRVLTDPTDRITTDELFPIVDDLAKIQDYMASNLNILQGAIDLDTFVRTDIATAVGAK